MKKCIFILLMIGFCSQSQADSNLLDLNDDGVDDIKYENSDEGYYEFIDRNFDGKFDESHFYTKNDVIQKSSYDGNFDGILETKVTYKNMSINFESVDSNNDNIKDIFYFYNSGTLEKGIKYYVEGENKGMVGTILFKFGYPEKEILTKSKKTQKEFEEATMPVQ